MFVPIIFTSTVRASGFLWGPEDVMAVPSLHSEAAQRNPFPFSGWETVHVRQAQPIVHPWEVAL